MTVDEQINVIRKSEYLEADWYLDQYPDVRILEMDAAEHYLKYGAMLGRDPGPAFSTKFYVTAYPDVKESGTNPLVHFLLFGVSEGRTPHP